MDTFEFKFKIVELKDDILTVFTDSGEKLCSDTIQNYTLKYYNVRTPIIGKIYLEVIFSHPAINRLIILKASDNDPMFEKLKGFCKYMKKSAKVDLVKNAASSLNPREERLFYYPLLPLLLYLYY